jgi:hypothetical protein
MNTVYKTKSQLREETSDAVQAFLAAGGKIEVVKSRKAPKQKMNGKTSKGYNGGTSGFAMGFVRSTL